MGDRLEQLIKLHDADPNDPFVTYGVAMEHTKSGDVEQALVWFDKTLSLDGVYCYAYYHKAALLAGADRVEDARRVLGEGRQAARDAGDQHAHDEMAELLASLDD